MCARNAAGGGKVNVSVTRGLVGRVGWLAAALSSCVKHCFHFAVRSFAGTLSE